MFCFLRFFISKFWLGMVQGQLCIVVSDWFGQGVMWGGHSMFCFLHFFISKFWLGMVQGQLCIVVSDWDPYLGSPFPFFQCGKLTLLVALCHVSVTVVFYRALVKVVHYVGNRVL
jgi:hypothetical protein